MSVKEDDYIGLIKQCIDNAAYIIMILILSGWIVVNMDIVDFDKVTGCEVTRKIYLHLAYYFGSALSKEMLKHRPYWYIRGRCKVDVRLFTESTFFCSLLHFN